ncbi:MAG: glycosyltransferase family 4 protein [Gemmatimonadaceae bacterium]|nr:glycosyltransferase family 4 protein [Gemmatimonadaceae bacterium]
MRIVHLITRLIIGGAQENTLASCQGQHDLGHDVTLITGPPLGPEGSLLDRAHSHGYKVEVLDEMRRAVLPGKDLLTYRAILRRLRQLKPDVVHTHSSKAGILGRWAAHRANVPAVIHTIHGLAFTASTRPAINWAYKWLERRAAPITTTIVCVADAMRDQSLRAGIGTKEQYVTVYSGMDTRPFIDPPVPRDEVRQRLNLEPRHVVAGTLARLFHLKGHDDLLALAPDLCRRYPDLRFLWIGQGILHDTFERRITEMNLRDRFVLTGLVPPTQVPELVNAMDILVHPSRREGLARAIPQGQLAGCPAIAYDIDGNREGLIPDETGFIIPPFDRQLLNQKLATLLEDRALAQRMGAGGRHFALARFDACVMIQALERVYADALKRG